MPSPSIALELAFRLSPAPSLSPGADWYARMEQAEKGDGWLAWCREHDVYIAMTQELVTALAQLLSRFSGTVLEIGSGNGELAHRLRERGVEIIATDCSPQNKRVLSLGAREALAMYRPATVLSSFLPLDGGVETDVLRWPGVHRYLYIGPILMDRVGPEELWRAAGWKSERLAEIDRVLISRLDFLADFTRRTHQRRAGAVLLERID